jgi:nickel-dependent lactate racemase
LSDALDVTVVEPRFVPGLPDPGAALQPALREPIEAPPLGDLVKSNAKVGVVFSDLTRPTPNHLILPAVLNELTHIPRENITLFNALGMHRPNTEAELSTMLGDALVDGYRIVQNDAFDPSTQVHLGVTTRSHDIWLNRELVECDVKILTGFIL